MGAFTVQIVMIIGLVASLVSVASANSGTATFYRPPYLPSACYGNHDDGTMIAAASDAFWDNKGACGKRYKVTCTGPTNPGVLPGMCRGSVVVKITNYCPGCAGTIDLSQEAFAAIADPVAGKIAVDFEEV